MAIEMQKIVAWAIGILVALVIIGFILAQLNTDAGLMGAFFERLRNLGP